VFSRKNDLKNHVANPNIHNQLEWNEEYCLILPLVDELMEIEIENFRPQETSQKSPISTKRNCNSEPTKHYKHLQLCPERKCKIGMGKTYTQFDRKWSEVKNKLY
jgi:hypothetical protein